jgi:hypothetical protein
MLYQYLLAIYFFLITLKDSAVKRELKERRKKMGGVPKNIHFVGLTTLINRCFNAVYFLLGLVLIG